MIWPESATVTRAEMDAAFVASLPRRPVVYALMDSAGEYVYIGQTECLRERWVSHRCRRMASSGWSVAWTDAPVESERLLLEAELINRIRPLENQEYICRHSPIRPRVRELLGSGMTYKNIGNLVGCTRQRIAQLAKVFGMSGIRKRGRPRL